LSGGHVHADAAGCHRLADGLCHLAPQGSGRYAGRRGQTVIWAGTGHRCQIPGSGGSGLSGAYRQSRSWDRAIRTIPQGTCLSFPCLLCRGAAKYGRCPYLFFRYLGSSEPCVSFCTTSLRCFSDICQLQTLDMQRALALREAYRHNRTEPAPGPFQRTSISVCRRRSRDEAPT